MNLIRSLVSPNAYRIPRRLKLVCTRLGSLILLFQRMPVVQLLFPEANFLGGVSLANSFGLAVTTVAGLGAFDSVAGQTTIDQTSPLLGSTTVPATVSAPLNFVFECTNAPSQPESWSSTALPAGLALTYTTTTPFNVYNNSITGTPTTAGKYPVTITVWKDPYYAVPGDSVPQLFNIYVLGFSTQPAATTTISSGGTTTLSCVVAGKPTGATLTYQWYQGTSGTTTTPVGTNSASFTTPALSTSTNYWVKITSVLSTSMVSARSNTAAVNVTAPPTTVSVAVSPASVLEDGASNLVYTFTRTGATTASLPINFTVGGTATLATDYTASGASTFTASTGTVSFAAGSATAAVTINPTPDTTVEPDETAVLTVATGTGYSVGAPAAATGTITNDDTVYSSWAAGLSAGQSGPGQTPQNDGVNNLLKFAFNLNPTKPDNRALTVGGGGTVGLPGVAVVGGKLRLEFLRRKASTNPGITYTPQFGSTLGTWTDFTGVPATVTSVDANWERVAVDDPSVGSTKHFGRVQVLQTP